MISDKVKKILSNENKKIATRDAYGQKLIVLDADLAKATKTVLFSKEFPII